MPILNKHQFYYIYSDGNWSAESPGILQPQTNLYDQRYYVKNYSTKDYWYIEFLNADAFFHFPVESIVPLEIIEKIKNKEIILLLSNAHEPYHEVVTGIYEHVIKKSKIPAEQIILSTMSHDIHLEIDVVSNRYKLGKIKTESLQEFEFMAKYEYLANIHDDNMFSANTLVDKHYDKKFVSFNGFPRNHRLMLVALLKCYDLIDRGYVSYITTGGAYDSMINYNRIVFNNLLNPKMLKILQDNKEKILSLTPMYLDTNSENHLVKNVASYSTNPKRYYEDTYFSVVTETMSDARHSSDGYTVGRSLSEKIYKPIVNKHPFVLSAVPGSLKLLKNLGYKTFSPYIDESYDEELNDSERMLKIVQEIKRLTELKPNELTEFLEFSREIVNHNFENIMNKNKWYYKLN